MKYCLNRQRHYFAAIFLGYKKPSFDMFLKPIVKQLINLEGGIIIDDVLTKFFLISSIHDKAAKA
jgi:hypothetical protein